MPPTAFSPWPAVRSLSLLLILVGLPSCSSSEPAADRYELPEVEPEEADTVEAGVIDQYRWELARSAQAGSAGGGSVNVGGNDDWPQLFGPHRNCVAAPQSVDLSWGAEGPRQRWSIEVGTGYGSPVVSAGRVVFNHRIGDEEIVQCVSAEGGQTLWTHRYDTTFECDVEYSDGPYSTPVICEERVYAVGGQGQMFCLALESGEPIWSRNLHEEFTVEDDLFPVGASPLIADGRVIFNLGAIDSEAGVIALDADTGADLWQSTDHGSGYCSPVTATIDGSDFLFVITNVGLVCLDPATGFMDWMVEHYCRSPMSYNAVSPLVVGDKVLIVTGPGPGAICVQVHADRTHSEVWRDRRILDSQFNTLMLCGDDVIGFTSAGQGGAELRCVEFATGELRWKYHSLLRRGQGLVIGDALVLLGERGHLAALVPTGDEAQVLAFTEKPLMSEPSYCAPALAGSRLYLKDETRLACFDLALADD